MLGVQPVRRTQSQPHPVQAQGKAATHLLQYLERPAAGPEEIFAVNLGFMQISSRRTIRQARGEAAPGRKGFLLPAQRNFANLGP